MFQDQKKLECQVALEFGNMLIIFIEQDCFVINFEIII